MVCYVFVTGGEFDRYRRSGVEVRWLGDRRSDDEFPGTSGGKRIRYKAFRDGDGLIVVVDGTEESLKTKDEVRKCLHPKADPDEISGVLIAYLSDLKSVINECAQDDAVNAVTLFTHWGGGMPQDVSAVERVVQKSLLVVQDPLAEGCPSPYKAWKAYSISSVRPEVFDISRGEIQIPDVQECAVIASRANAHGGVRNWLNALALVCASAYPELLIESLSNPAPNPDDLQQIVERIGKLAEPKDVCDFTCRLVEEGSKEKNDLLGLLKSGCAVSDSNLTLKECSAALLAQLVIGEV